MARGLPVVSAVEPQGPKAKPAKAPKPRPDVGAEAEADAEDVGESFAKTRSRAAKATALADDFKGWRPAAKVLRLVEAVPTQFPDYDIATKVGGHPLGRITVVHGESAEGKTEFCLGLGRSFLEAGHFFGFLDAERTTPIDWVEKMYGALLGHERFLALQPDNTYEQARAAVRNFCTTIAELRVKNRIAPNTTGLLLVDSIRKLQPKDLMKQLGAEMFHDTDPAKGPRGRGKPKGHIDGAGGRAGQIKAAYNAAWMDELVPLLADTNCTLVIIARQTKDPTQDTFYTEGFKIGGGEALRFESSLLLGISATGVWTPGDDGKKRQVGEKHIIGIEKSKVAGKQERVVQAVFHTSNGVERPEGFWRARDVFTVGTELGVIEQNGSHYRFDGKRIGHGEPGCVQRLDEDAELCQAVERAAREAAKPSA